MSVLVINYSWFAHFRKHVRQKLCNTVREKCLVCHGIVDIYAGRQAEEMLNRGIFRMEEYVEGGWLSGLRYEDEVLKDLEKRTDSKPNELKTVRGARPIHPHPCHLDQAKGACRA